MLAGADFGPPQLRGLVLDKSAAYYLRDTGKLVAVPFDGSTVQLARDGEPCEVGDVAVDDNDVYWACDARVYKVGKRGDEVRALYKASGKIVGLAVDATHVYFATWPENVVKKLPK